MASVSLKRIETRVLETLSEIDRTAREARYGFSRRELTVSNRKELLEVGKAFENSVRAGIEGVAPNALNQDIGGYDFVAAAISAYGQYGGFAGAVNVATTGEDKGLQGIFDKLTDLIVNEITQKAIARILEEEVDESDPKQVESIARQLQSGEDLSKDALWGIMKSWKQLVLYRVNEKRRWTLMFGKA